MRGQRAIGVPVEVAIREKVDAVPTAILSRRAGFEDSEAR
jgi:hypothetical protein